MLARLTLDASVVDDVEVWPAAQDAIALIASSIPPFAWDETVSQVSRSLISFVRDPQLRLQLINCLPVYVPRLHTLRRRLALAYFFEDSANITASADYLANIPRIIRHLQKPQFSINANTNYPVLGALMSLLDIGIDDGVSPDSFPDAESENLYNREVDSLATCIKAIFTRISDSGASHMARTEAKENIERIHHRLLYAVRTKEKPKIGIFGGNFGGVDDTPSGLMPKFLLKPKPSADHNG
ncbi:MAG: hypothetical protein M1829_006553 [Trizodia sp. TS-e1964]|nr:MAG: hypothetical protein M1829_006553 [Trizodia sp. TS-e1964]